MKEGVGEGAREGEAVGGGVVVASHLGAHPGAWGGAGRWGRSQWEGGGRVGSQGEVLRPQGLEMLLLW